MARLLGALGLLLLGLLGGAAATLLHQRGWGLALGLAAGLATTLALPGGRWRLAFATGWTLAVAALMLPRAEGDYLIPGNLAGYALLGGSFTLFLLALATARPTGARPVDPGNRPPAT